MKNSIGTMSVSLFQKQNAYKFMSLHDKAVTPVNLKYRVCIQSLLSAKTDLEKDKSQLTVLFFIWCYIHQNNSILTDLAALAGT